MEGCEIIVRPREYSAGELETAFNIYVDETDMPTVEGFCAKHSMAKSTFYKYVNEDPGLSNGKEKADTKAEDYLVKSALAGKGHPIFTIFLLKQSRFGYKDKVEQEIKSEITVDIQLPDGMKRIAE